MEQNYTKLLEQLSCLEKVFYELGTRLSLVATELQSPGKPPSESFAEQIILAREEFADFCAKVLELAESLAVSRSEEIPQNASLQNLKSLLEEITEKERQKARFKEVQNRALTVLERVLSITTQDGSDFLPLKECQKQAKALRNDIEDAQCLDLHPDIQALANEEHPFTALLKLTERKGDENYSTYARLQKVVAESFSGFGEELAVAALMGAFSTPIKSSSLIQERNFTSVEEDNQTTSIVDSGESETISSEQLCKTAIEVSGFSEETEVAQDCAKQFPIIEETNCAEQLPQSTCQLDEEIHEPSHSLLHNRYKLNHQLLCNDNTEQFSESWFGEDEDCSQYLIKLQRYQEKQPNEVLRRIWDNQLRTLYRLSSSPGAEESLLTLHDAGIDRTQRAFVMG
jgi:hypothetical protein